MNLTYEQLRDKINEMTPEQQKSNVVVYDQDMDSYFEGTLEFTDDRQDVLDPNHPFIYIFR